MRARYDLPNLSVKVPVATVLTHLRTNRELHKAEAKEAKVARQQQLLEEYEKAVERIKLGEAQPRIKQMPAVPDHTEDYDSAIKLLEMSSDKDIVLDTAAVDCFVRDRWDWKQDFEANTSGYLGG